MVTKVPQPHLPPSVAKIKPRITYWRHGMWFAEAAGIASAGYSVAEAFERWQSRWQSMEAIAPLKVSAPVRQYYYQSNTCTALDTKDPNCTCWHDEGTGPLGDPDFNRKYCWVFDESKLSWRNKP